MLESTTQKTGDWQTASKIKLLRLQSDGRVSSEVVQAIQAELNDLAAKQTDAQARVNSALETRARHGLLPDGNSQKVAMDQQISALKTELIAIGEAITDTKLRYTAASKNFNTVQGLASDAKRALITCGVTL